MGQVYRGRIEASVRWRTSAGERSTPSAAKEYRALSDTLGSPTAISTSLLSIVRRWYWVSGLRVLLTAVRTLPHRMRLALEIHRWEMRVIRALGQEIGQNYLGTGVNSGKKKGTTEAVPLNPCP